MKKFLYIFVAIAALVCILYLIPRNHYHKWDITHAAPEGHEPYDMVVFDSLLCNSLPNGYDVKRWKVVAKTDDDDVADDAVVVNDEDDDDVVIEDSVVYEDDEDNNVPLYKDIDKRLHLTDSLNPKKQNVLIVQRYEWTDNIGINVTPLIDAFDYANKGGDVLVVKEQIEYSDYFLNSMTELLGTSMDYGQAHPNYPFGYDAKDLSKREDDVYFAKTPDGNLRIHNRFAPSYLIKDNSNIYDSPEAVSIVNEMKLSMKPYLSTYNDGKIYGVVFHNEKSGGNVYFCTLGLYFSNLGVTIPDADRIIAYNMGKIDRKPVVRIDYEKYTRKDVSSDSGLDKLLSVLAKDKALSFAWIMFLVMVVLVLICGIYRKHPAKRDAHLIYVDETDPVAVREAKFRQSPLLHFIFQYSWLYKGKRNYTELFLINYRQFARYVNRKSGVELISADEKELEKASNALALRTGLDLSLIRQDLIWMQINKLNVDNATTILPQDYIKSQRIIEKYL